VDLTELCLQLELMILRVFSNLNDSILYMKKKFLGNFQL